MTGHQTNHHHCHTHTAPLWTTGTDTAPFETPGDAVATHRNILWPGSRGPEPRETAPAVDRTQGDSLHAGFLRCPTGAPSVQSEVLSIGQVPQVRHGHPQQLACASGLQLGLPSHVPHAHI